MTLLLRDEVFEPIWLASISTSTLFKIYKPELIESVNVAEICDKLLSTIICKNNGNKKRPNEMNVFQQTSMPLRLQANLCIGTVRIFQHQVNQLVNDCTKMCLETYTNICMQRKTTKRQSTRGQTQTIKRVCLSDTTNLPAAHFQELMEEEWQSLQSLSHSSLAIETNINVQVNNITMQDIYQDYTSVSLEVENQVNENFDNGSDILEYNDLLKTRTIYSNATPERRSNASYTFIASPPKEDGLLRSTGSTIIERQRITKIKKSATTTRKTTHKCLLKKNNLHKKPQIVHKSLKIAINSTPRVLRKRVSSNKNAPTPNKRAKILRKEQTYESNTEILNESYALSDENNNQQDTENMEDCITKQYSTENIVNNSQANITEQESFTYWQSERQKEMWLPTGVLNSLAHIWLLLNIDEGYTINVYWFLEKASSRFDRALGFHSLLTLARDGLIELFNYNDTIQIRYTNNKHI